MLNSSRKSPYEHKVRSHKRRTPNGEVVEVNTYKRGSGNRPEQKESKVVKRNSSNTETSSEYSVSILYKDSTQENFSISSPRHTEAVKTALQTRKSISFPKKVVVRAQ